MQSIEERPGKLNIGLITLVSNAPTNSNKPKSNNKGSNIPANIKTENNIGSKS